ncbi:MAG: RluA family pseudouridine synthase [Aureispira sp.]|nr:RluA family pseudouridine synthase [Aureispira sp.]
MKKNYDILFEDDHILVVNKHYNFLTIPDRFRPDLPNLYNELEKKYGKIFVVHRLDKGTSGTICFAKTAEAHKHISQQFESRSTKKLYWAVVDGCPMEKEGRIEATIARHPTKAGIMTIHRKGKPSITDYKVLDTFKECSLVEASILTGRTHQIRIHLKHIGHPLVVDKDYGKRDKLFLSEIKKRKFNLGKYEEERPLLSRAALHAANLTIKHPSTGKKMTFEAPMPKDLKALLNQLSKWSK